MYNKFSQGIKNNIKYLLPAAAVCIVSRGFSIISWMYYLTPILLLLFIAAGINEIKNHKYLRIFLLFNFVFFIWSLATSIWSLYPIVSLSRSFYYLLISSGCILGAFLYSNKNDNGTFDFLLYANLLIVLLSLVSLFFSIPGDAWTGGNGKGLMGFAGHQNTLAALLLFTMPAGLWGVIKEVKEKVKQGKKVKVEGEVKKSRIKILFYIILTAVNALLLILTYSRASIAGLLIALAIYVTFIYRWKAIVVIVSGTVLIGGIIYLNPFIKKEASKIILKDFPNLLFSREILVEPSLKAAEHGGLIGLGYGVSDPNILVPGTGSHYENGRYVREKGNSILGLIEESGVIGLILFLIPSGLLIYYMINSIRKAGKDRAGYDHSLLTRTYEIADEQTRTDLRVIAFTFAFMIAFTFHAQFEAWWVGVGSTQMPLFFAYVGLAIGVLNQDKSEKVKLFE